MLLEEQKRIHQRRSTFDLFTRTRNCERPARTYLQQLCTDTGSILVDMPEVMYDKRRMARERVREIRAISMIRRRWYIYRYIYIVAAISWGTEQQEISKWFLLEIICMYIHEIFTKSTWNIYAFIAYKVFFLLQRINSQLKKERYSFCRGQKLRNAW